MFLGGAEKSKHLGRLFREAAKRSGVAFLDAGAVIESSTVDGIHFDSDAHRVLGNEIARAM